MRSKAENSTFQRSQIVFLFPFLIKALSTHQEASAVVKVLPFLAQLIELLELQFHQIAGLSVARLALRTGTAELESAGLDEWLLAYFLEKAN